MSDTITVRRLATHEDLTAAADLDVLRTMGLSPQHAQGAWATSDAAAVAFFFPAEGQDDEGWVVVMRGPVRRVAGEDSVGEEGPGEASVHLAEAVRAELGGQMDGLTVPRSAALVPALTRWKMQRGDEWDLMVCDTPPPPQPGESLVRSDLGAAEIQAFLDRVNPHHSVRADDPTAESWVGVRDELGEHGDEGALLAVGALTRRRTGVGYLASIATDPAVRGTGHGSAVTANLTRQVFDAGETHCTLAHYHPNDSARRIYLRTGYRTLAQNYSGNFA